MQPESNAGILHMLFMFLPIILVWYLLVIKPEKKKQKERGEMIEALKKNDEAVTSGGIHGTIVNVKEKTFVLRIDDNCKIEVEKNSISYAKKKKE